MARGYFTPEEDARLRAWFARYLTLRGELLATIEDLRPLIRAGGEDQRAIWRGSVVGALAAGHLVGAGRFLVTELAADAVVQRKLNEAAPEHRIPRKQFTSIYRSLTSPRNAWHLSRTVPVLEETEGWADDPLLAPLLDQREPALRALEVSVREYLRARLRFRRHSAGRRGASAREQALFGLLESSGRIVAELRLARRRRVTPKVRDRLASLLEPGDVVVTRYERALSNLFLPGFWPHVGLHIGRAVDTPRGATNDHVNRWVEPLRVLEARKDGVLLRELSDTMSVDAVAIIRPKLTRDEISAGIDRALLHEGKGYNFDFDFFAADRLVCTEVVYRAYDGLGAIELPLTRRSGRMTLSAEDLVGHAVAEGGLFEAIAAYGCPGARRRVVQGPAASAILRRSLYTAGGGDDNE